MQLEFLSQCPICNGTSFRDFLSCKDYTATGESFQIVSCEACQFKITNPRPNSSSISKYYQSDSYISHTNKSKGILDRIYLIARHFTLKSKRKLIEEFSTKGELLDYGSGTGHFLLHCSQNDWKCEGVEPSHDARAKQSDLKIHQTLDEISKKKFDAITLWHVLEHVHELNSTLSKLTSLLKEKGTLFIAVPNPESDDAKQYQNFWAAYDVPRHLWHFSKENITALLAQNGLKIVAIKPMKLDSFYVSLLSEKYKNPNTSKFIQMTRGFLSGLRSNRKAVKKMNYSSLIYIAQR